MGLIIKKNKLVEYKYEENITSVTVPDGVKIIAPSAFGYAARNLTEIILPDSVRTIGSCAFSWCRKLEKISIPEGVQKIYSRTFSKCSALHSVTLPQSLEALGAETFTECENLREIVIPDRVEKFGANLFIHCMNLQSVTYRGIVIHPERYELWENSHLERLLNIILTQNFNISLKPEAKFAVAFQMYQQGIAAATAEEYVRKNFPKGFRSLILAEDTDLVQQILDTGTFISARNLDRYLQFAIENGSTEVSLLLMEYKNQNIGYKRPEDRFRL